MIVIRHTPAFIAVRQSLVDDGRLSWGARGLMVWIDAQPNDWQFNFDDLVKASGEAYAPFEPRSIVDEYVDELLAIGYLERDEDA